MKRAAAGRGWGEKDGKVTGEREKEMERWCRYMHRHERHTD